MSKRWVSSCVESARRMLLATPVSLAPDNTNTLTSTGSLPPPGVTRNTSSPLDDALPLEAMFQALDSGTELPLASSGGCCAVAGSARTSAASQPQPAAPRRIPGRVWEILFALDLDADVL